MMANTHETLSFRAEISLDEAALTGRPGFGSGIRPNHHLPGRDYCVLGQIDFIDVAWLSPGSKCQANCVFVVPQEDVSMFVPGFRWEFSEGVRRIGCGILLSMGGT
jgi:hypothetical protein